MVLLAQIFNFLQIFTGYSLINLEKAAFIYFPGSCLFATVILVQGPLEQNGKTWSGQLSVASSLPPSHHHQVTSANSPLPRCCRRTPHSQLAEGGQRDSQVGEGVDRTPSGSSHQALPIFTHPATTTATEVELWAEEAGDSGSGSGRQGGSRDVVANGEGCPIFTYICCRCCCCCNGLWDKEARDGSSGSMVCVKNGTPLPISIAAAILGLFGLATTVVVGVKMGHFQLSPLLYAHPPAWLSLWPPMVSCSHSELSMWSFPATSSWH